MSLATTDRPSARDGSLMLAAPMTAMPILVVDDDNQLLETLADILRLHGYDPRVASSGAEGLALAAEMSAPPPLALVDLRLPDMNGLDLITELHSLAESMQVVILTGNASIETAVAAMREKSIDYLIKPIDLERLMRTVAVAGERWQRQQVEATLRVANERFRRAVESDLFGVMFWNDAGQITEANDAFLQLLGYSRDELLRGPLKVSELTPPQYDELEESARVTLEAVGKVAPYQKEFVRKDGQLVPVLMGASLLDGGSDHAVCYVVDVSDRRRAEVALRERERQQAAVAALGRELIEVRDLAVMYQTAATVVADTLCVEFSNVLEATPDRGRLILRAGVGWRNGSINKAGIAVTEETPAGVAFRGAEPVLVDDLPHDPRFTEAAFLHDHQIISGITVAIPGVERRFGVLGVHTTHARAFTQDDVYFLLAVAHLLGSAAQRDQSDGAFRQTQRLEAVGRLAGGVAHDFNNLLTAIGGYAQLVMSALPPESPLREDIEEITKASGRAAALTNQLLAFSRQQVLQPRAFSLNEVVVEMHRMLGRMIGEHIHLKTVLQADLREVSADPGQIEQVIVNLVVNARDAMPDGGTLVLETRAVTVEATEGDEEAPPPGSYLMLVVSDSGIGMDNHLRARIFEPFFTTKGAEGGTGLGLATVYGIVKQSCGYISVESEPQHGTTFRLYLPYAKTPGPAAPLAPVRAGASSGETVMLVEDEQTVRRLGKRILEAGGYQVISASDPIEALRLSEAYQGTIHLLATDMVMPHMSGRDLAIRLVAMRPETRVLYMSGYTDPGVLRHGPVGVEAAYLQKPFSSDALIDKVREVLDGP